MTADENTRFRLSEIERRLDEASDDRSAQTEKIKEVAASIAELLELFNSAKSVVHFVTFIGKFSIACGAVVAAIGVLWLAFKGIFVWESKL